MLARRALRSAVRARSGMTGAVVAESPYSASWRWVSRGRGAAVPGVVRMQVRRVAHVAGVDLGKRAAVEAAEAAANPGVGRTLAGILGGTVAMGLWCHFRPQFLSPPTLPGSGLLTLAAGVATFRYIAPGASFLAFVGGTAILTPLALMLAAVGALAVVDTRVHMTRTQRRGMVERMYRMAERQGAVMTGDVDDKIDHMLPALKMLFFAMCDKRDRCESTGELVLSRRRIRELRNMYESDAAKRDHDTDPAVDAAVTKFVSLFDEDGNDVISFHEFASGMLCMLFADESDVQLRNDMWFRALDLDNSGTITRDELEFWVKAMMRAGAVSAVDGVVSDGVLEKRPATAAEIADRWMARYDVNGDGGISREEFTAMCQAVDFAPIMPSRDWLDVVRVNV